MAQIPFTSEDLPKEHFVRPIPFKAHKISGFTPELFERYYEEDYGGRVRSLNEIECKIATARQVKEAEPELVLLGTQQTECIGSIVLQELFLEGLGEDGGEPLEDSDLKRALLQAFGSVANWQAEFVQQATLARDMEGWIVLAWCERFKRLMNISTQDGSLALCGTVPILALDLRERVYSPDFGTDQRSYTNAYIRSIHWGRIAEGLRAARGAGSDNQQAHNDGEQITIAELKSLMESKDDALLVLDVRHDDDRERYTARIAKTDWRDSFCVSEWVNNLPKDKLVVVYCMYGFWVSQKVAEELRAEGVDARSLTGGITAWRAMEFPSSENGAQ